MGALAKNTLTFGLSAEILNDLREVFSQFADIDRVLIYGSRAHGDFRPGSDIDLAVLAPMMETHEFSKLWMALDDLPIIFRLDVSLHHEVADQQLKHNMLADGITLYQAATNSSTSPPPSQV
ncbi:nucleotidyltransferase domain-containing protein [Duganella sp. CT11-25]|uniref:nucleotidyltransferase domain-containing protein n=1 Tax=unclassified Duganella TaxID=2636909 RepID=UPI0039AFBE48